MGMLNHQPTCFTYIGFQLNSLLDKNEFWDIDDIGKKAQNGTLIDWLERKIDMSLFDAEDKTILGVEFCELYECVDSERKFGVKKNGICLIIAYCYELIQNPPSRTYEDCKDFEYSK